MAEQIAQKAEGAQQQPAPRACGHDVGLLVLRVGIGILFILHGWPKLTGGPDLWARLGGAMGGLGITFAPAFWGFMAAFSEAVGGLALALGVLVRPMSALMLINMLVATHMHVSKGDPFATFSHPLALAVVFVSLILLGPGRYALGRFIPGLRGACCQ
jgi:putative oxidoreductase